jgi:hypothetical protein
MIWLDLGGRTASKAYPMMMDPVHKISSGTRNFSYMFIDVPGNMSIMVFRWAFFMITDTEFTKDFLKSKKQELIIK